MILPCLHASLAFTPFPRIGGMVAIMERSILAAACRVLRDAAWLTTARVKAYGRILAVMTLVCSIAWIGLSRGGLDPAGKPLGTDFLSFWAASELALGGHAAAAYEPAVHAAAERAVFDGAKFGYAAFFYPPVFLLLCLPLAALPYLASLGAWLGLTGFAYWCVMRRWLAKAAGPLPILAFPAVLLNTGHGQNAFLSTALFGGGGLLLARRPLLAGICFGALAFKPHLAILIPIALFAAGRWRAIAGAALTLTALVALSLAAFGAAAWRGFFAASALARIALEGDSIGAAKMQSLFAAIQLSGGSVTAAYAGQALLSLGVAATVWLIARRQPGHHALGALMIAATLLATPFLLDYDLLLAAIPLAWLVSAGLKDGFLPWEKTILAAAFVLPLLSRAAAMQFGIALAPPVLAALFAIVIRRALRECNPASDAELLPVRVIEPRTF